MSIFCVFLIDAKMVSIVLHWFAFVLIVRKVNERRVVQKLT